MITVDDFTQLMLGFFLAKSKASITVAVSGGPDSLCLLYLANRWAKQHNHEIVAITVDHDLRAESADETKYVANLCKNLNIKHVGLKWSGYKPKTSIQENARTARYELMSEWCYTNGFTTLMTAHHAEDNWETYMQRLAKGSGLTGLTGIAAVTYHKFGQLLRPLLNISKQDILATLACTGLKAVLDPSNISDNYTRVRWRKLYGSLAKEGLDAMAIQTTQQRLKSSEQFIISKVNELLARNVYISSLGYITIPSTIIFNELELVQRIISSITYFLSQLEYVPPISSIEYAVKELRNNRTTSAASCILKPCGEKIVVYRDIRTLPIVIVKPGAEELWAGLLSIKNNTQQLVTAKPLGKQGIRELQGKGWIQRDSVIPHPLHQSLLSIWNEGELLFVPGVNQENSLACDVSLAPQRPLETVYTFGF